MKLSINQLSMIRTSVKKLGACLLACCCSFSALAADETTTAAENLTNAAVTEAAGTATTMAAGSDATAATTEDADSEASNLSETDTADDTQTPSMRYACSLQDLERRVEVDYPNAPAQLPCEVNYYKDVETPGTQQTLWSAQNTAGYCEQRAEEFVNKLVGLGWNCETRQQ